MPNFVPSGIESRRVGSGQIALSDSVRGNRPAMWSSSSIVNLTMCAASVLSIPPFRRVSAGNISTYLRRQAIAAR